MENHRTISGVVNKFLSTPALAILDPKTFLFISILFISRIRKLLQFLEEYQ
jgi:hypothetical protein